MAGEDPMITHNCVHMTAAKHSVTGSAAAAVAAPTAAAPPDAAAAAADARDIVSSMPERDPSKRPTAAELLHHPWLIEAGRCRSCWNTSSSSGSSNAACSIGSNEGSNGGNGRGQQQQQQQIPLYLQRTVWCSGCSGMALSADSNRWVGGGRDYCA